MISLSSKQLSLVTWKAEIWVKCDRFLPLCVCQFCGLIMLLPCWSTNYLPKPDTRIWSTEIIKCSIACCVQVSSHFFSVMQKKPKKKLIRYYKQWCIKSVGAALESRKLHSASLSMRFFRCCVFTWWGLATCNSTDRNYSIWFVSQNIGLNQEIYNKK